MKSINQLIGDFLIPHLEKFVEIAMDEEAFQSAKLEGFGAENYSSFMPQNPAVLLCYVCRDAYRADF